MPTASCHCGAIQITLDQKPESLTECNCSICRRYAALWAFYTPDSAQLSFASDVTLNYLWDKEILKFYFCKNCGCVTHNIETRDPVASRIAVNARMMSPEDIMGIKVRTFDGADTWKYLDE